MATKKADLEAERDAYESYIAHAVAAERDGLFLVAMRSAAAACRHIDGMMQYRRRYDDAAFKSVDAIDLILKYAPLLFHFETLNEVHNLLRNQKRIDRYASDDLTQRVEQAQRQMWQNHRLFAFLMENPGFRQDELRARLGGDQGYWRNVAESWEKMRLVRRTPERGSYRLCLSTRLGEVVEGKCPRCGQVDSAPKAMLLEPVRCSKCRGESVFILLPSAEDGNL